MRQKPAMICKLYHLHLHLSPFGILNDIVVFVINTTHVYHAVFKNSCHLLANRKDPSRDLVCFYRTQVSLVRSMGLVVSH